jgi:hypothetical protein
MFCYVVVFLAAGSEAAPVAHSGEATRLALSDEDRGLVAGTSALTFSVMDIEAEAGSEVPINATLPSEVELRAAGATASTFVLIRNIPEGVAISPGVATGRIRVVPLRDAASLRLLSKPELEANFQLQFTLIGPHNRALAQTTASVTLRPGPAVAAPAPAASDAPKTDEQTAAVEPRPQPEPEPERFKPPADAPPAASKQPKEAEPISPQVEAVLLARGKSVLQQGGIAAARIIFEELASLSSAAGAFALAQTYDPASAPRTAGATPAPSLAEARKWYQRASELGNADAERRLAEIGSGR